MRRIYLLRHAKSSWDEPGIPDHDRPLAPRGKRAAKAMAKHLREHDVRPDVVLCSTAKRARKTLKRIEPVLGKPDVHYERELYAASAATLLARLRDIPKSVDSVMVIGHNPGLEDLVLVLTEQPTTFPTGALATLAFTGREWAALERGMAELVDVVRPRELAG
jgi:phosphohistidine phosphatase